MKIALFSDTFVPQLNGVVSTVKNSAHALGELGHEVRIYTISGKSGKELTRKSNNLYTVVTLPSSSLPLYPGARLSLPLGIALSNLRTWRPDIIHIHTPFSVGLEGILCAKMFKIPLIGTHHTFFDHYLKYVHLDYGWAKKLSWSTTVAFYNRADFVISPTKSLRDELISHGLKKPIKILPNSVDFQTFQNNTKLNALSKEDLKKKFGIPGKSIVVMGRIGYEKSIDDVIRAVAKIIKKIPNIRFMIIGDGPEKENLITLSNKLKIKDNVIFTGFLQEKPLVEALLANDIFVTASRSENMPLALLEVMTLGLPIVAVSSLGICEIVENNSNGILLPPEDTNKTIECIAEAILKLFADDNLRERFSVHSQKLSEKYSEKEVAKKLVEIYEDAIAKRSFDIPKDIAKRSFDISKDINLKKSESN